MMNEIESNLYFSEAKKIPKILYYRGNLLNDKNKRIAIVGSRRPSPYTKVIIEKILVGLKGKNISIVSGLAIGTDTIVHETALKFGLHTIAIPGSGLEESVIYPASNLRLSKNILSSGGALLSIWKDQKAAIWTFPVRNTLMAAISDFVLIVEATEKSGTMITAREALKRDIILGAIPGNIDSILSEGPNDLIKRGAKCITSARDILSTLNISDNIFEGNYTCSSDPILKHITEPCHRDTLALLTGIGVSELNTKLTLLEISGDISIDKTGYIRLL